MENVTLSFRGLEPRESTSWNYGARVEASEALEEQFTLAHRTYNQMVEVTRHALAALTDWFCEKDPEIARLGAAIERLSAQWSEAKARDARDELEQIAAERRFLRKDWYERCFAVRKDNRSEVNALIRQWVGLTKESRLYAVRTEAVKAGLYWASATAVMTAVQQAWDKQFPRLRPVAFSKRAEKTRETLVVQFTEAGGVPMSTLHSKHGGLWIEPPGDGLLTAWANGRRPARPDRYLRFRMRIGGRGREGVYVEGSVQMVRPVPEGARVMMARLVRERVATKYRHQLQLVLRLAEPLSIPTETKEPRVALDLGWYYEAGLGRRVIAYTGGDNEDAVEQIYLPPGIDEAFDRVDDMNSRRSLARDDVAITLRCCQWDDAPAPLAETLAAINKAPVAHVAQARLARLVWQWRNEHSDYRPDVLAELWSWRRWDKKLYEASAHLRRRTAGQRKKFYEHWARYFASRYTTIVVVRPALREAAVIKNEASGEHTALTARARQGRVRAALYDFLNAVATKAAETGSVVIEVSGRTTTECSACGAIMAVPEENPATRTLVCHACGVSHDREANSAVLAYRVPDDDGAVTQSLEHAQEQADRARERRERRRQAMREGRWKGKQSAGGGD